MLESHFTDEGEEEQANAFAPATVAGSTDADAMAVSAGKSQSMNMSSNMANSMSNSMGNSQQMGSSTNSMNVSANA